MKLIKKDGMFLFKFGLKVKFEDIWKFYFFVVELRKL